MGGGSQGVFSRAEALDDILFAQKGVKSAADVGVIFNDDNALVLDLAGHEAKISRELNTARTI
jgi:hypothetical protein